MAAALDQELSPLTPARRRACRANLLAWYDARRRDLPWRRSPTNPYHVWVSEVMLQQTQVISVIPYFQRFIQRFPSVHALAAAPIDEVLRLWAGLGYYRRAHQLHAAAVAVVNLFGGSIPGEVAALQRLPGVGRYTAGAIASIAFGRRAALVDGNVARVLSRLHHPIPGADDATRRENCWRIAEWLVPADRPGDFNQAVMELGATCCTPVAPDCAACPLRRGCAARRAGVQNDVPPARRRVAAPTVELVSIVLVCRGMALLERRPPGGLWAGLWDVPSEVASGGSPRAVRDALHTLAKRVGIEAAACRSLGEVRRSLTHRRLRFHVHAARVDRRGRRAETWKWCRPPFDALGASQAARAVLALALHAPP